MRFIFKAVGVFIIISAAISTIYAIAQQVNFFVALLAGIYGVVTGALFFIVGGLINKVEALQWKVAALNAPEPEKVKGNRRPCPRCGKLYGVGQSKCPYCGAAEKTDEICYND